MMKGLLLASFISVGLISFSQNKNEHPCAHGKISNNAQAKSNQLSIADIARTEKYDVNFYDLDIAMSNLNTDVNGTAGFHATVVEDLDTIQFELFSSHVVTEVRLNGVSVPYIHLNNNIKVEAALIASDAFDIYVDYGGTPPNSSSNPFGGGGMSNDSSPTWGNQVTWSLSESFAAYEWFPCKQSLTDKADSVDVSITVANNLMAGSQGLLVSTIDNGDGTQTFNWESRYPIVYYLISVAVAEYVEYNIYANPTGATNPILVQNFIYNNPNTLPNFQTRIDNTVDFLEHFSDLFGLYPFEQEKYGHCMAPLSGGMEHQTMTTQGFFQDWLTAHELGHQWFGDHVTCNSWADIWVNEGFASYSEYIMYEEFDPGQEVTDMEDRHSFIMSQPNGSVWVEDSLNESRIFSSRLTYDKGAAIVHTLRFLIDDDAEFYQALRDFQTTYSHGTASGLDFKASAETSTGLDFTEFFEDWYFGEGYPTYGVTYNLIGEELHIELGQSTSMPGITPYFRNDLELLVSRTIGDTIIRLPVSFATQQYIVNINSTDGTITEIDPNNWIINDDNGIVLDNTFEYVGVKENEFISAKIYPNPSNGPVTIQMSDNKSYVLKLISQEGKFIKSINFNGQITLNTDEIAKGNYLIQIESVDGASITRKLLKI